ncbi:MAG: DEAD/DEAH box helicase, partial [Nocardioides sp.]
MTSSPRTASIDGAEVLRRLAVRPGREDRLTHLEVLPAREGTRVDWPTWVAPELVASWRERGIERPWSHQVQAAEAARRGEHVVLSTGTASGKSLGYLMPALTTILESRGPRGRRGATVLYLSPTKALAQDQLASLLALGVPGLAATTHDGDSPREQRDFARDHGEYVLTNPDMLHRSLLPGHARWARFFGALRYVVIDECHHYRGVFGAHVAQILRRLRRVCASYGAEPTFVMASATVAEPEVSAGRLTGLPVTAVGEDGSARGSVSLALWEPPFTSYGGENGAPVRRSAGAEVADLLTDLVLEDVRTLAFIRSRRGAETVALSTRRLLDEVAPGLADRVAAYRGGYLPEDRRALEHALRSGELLGIAATNALELGIDVAGLDAVLMAGFPGTRAALWQQIGRAGRGGQDALGVFVARDDPLDTYLVTHPEALLGAPVEANVFDPENPYVLGPHLCAAAEELPLTDDELDLFGPGARAGVDALTEAGLLRRRPQGWFWTDRRRASDLADIRSTGGAPVRLVEEETGRMLGTVDQASAHGTVHEGAVYLHQGETYLVRALDLDEHVAVVAAADPDYSTSAREVTDIAILSEREHASWGPARISFGSVRVTHQVV